MSSNMSESVSSANACNEGETSAVVDEQANDSAEASGQALLLGAVFITAGFLANTVQGALGKEAQNAIAPGQFLWLLLVMALAVLLPVSLWRRENVFATAWQQEVLPFYLLRAVFGLCSFYLFIWAAALGSLVDATVLLNTTPIFIPLIAVFILGKEISWTLWGAIALGFAGLLLVVQPNAELLQNPANLLGLGAGLAAAIEFLTVRWLSKTQSSLAQTLGYLVLGSILMTPVALLQWQPIAVETLKIVAAAAGSFLTFQLFLVTAYSFAEPHQIGVFQYTSVIFSVAIGWYFFAEVPNTLALFGMVLISIGGALSIYLEQRLEQERQPSEESLAS